MSIFPDFDRLTPLTGFGRAAQSTSYLYRPTHVEQIAELFREAATRGLSVALRGAGRSYGDAALNAGQIVLDLQRMNRVLAWDPATGVITVEPGVTIEQLWKYTLEDGWWPPVVPGTMFPTLGGCLGMNIHGKNNYHTGPIGEHVLACEALLPTGELVRCAPGERPDLFYSLISSAGLLGVFTSITLQLKRIYSGDLAVEAWAAPSLQDMLADIDRCREADYIVGWVDGTTGGAHLGRGQIHRARYLAPGEDAHPAHSLSLAYQDLPDTLFGLIPKAIIWRFMPLGLNRLGMRFANLGKYLISRTLSHHHLYRQGLVAFNFLLDYVPRWQHGYRHGLIQYQTFIPQAQAADVYRAQLAEAQGRGFATFVNVLKRHRPDRFLFSHAVDGYSLAIDFKVPGSRSGRTDLYAMTQRLNEIALEAGGRFYFAKDSTLTPAAAARYLGPDTLTRFAALKARCDPGGLLQTELYRRVLAPALNGGAPTAPAAAALRLPERAAVPEAGPGSNGQGR
ncbi:MAG: FAD-binding oxidoreductase [Anaerolineales bacterium]|nr:FAD-binding oxidoreductase [Anaerolineales bacterium]